MLAISTSTQFVVPSFTPLVSATSAIGEVKLESVAHVARRTEKKNKDATTEARTIMGQKLTKFELDQRVI
jgi:hypothetical protein